MSNPLLTAALDYADRGWAVFPCHAPDTGGCSCRRAACGSPAKHPRTPHGLRDATTDPAAIRAWWRRWPNANVAVRTGAVNGLIVLDVDPVHDGLRTLEDLLQRHGRFPSTPAARSGGGGRHYWFHHPGGTIGNSAGRIGAGLDVRGDGGYVIAPPSRHPSGGLYYWKARSDLAPAPEWLLVLCRQPAMARSISGPDPRCAADATRWARAALAGEIRRVGAAGKGTRNDTLNRAAFALGQLVGAGHLDANTVNHALRNAGEQIGLSAAETRATVASGLQAGSRCPRSPQRRSAFVE